MPEFDPPPTRPTVRHWTVAALALVAIGLLILVPSGLCTGILGVGMLMTTVTEGGNQGEVLSALGTIATFGLPPMLVGFLLVRAGLKARRKE